MSDYCIKKNKSCYKKDSLIKIANQYNKYYDDKINIYSSKLYQDIKSRLNKKSECKKDICWLNLDFVKEIKPELIHNFRPLVPNDWITDKDKWLNSLDINNVMKQYENKYNDFIFIGTIPRDFNKKIYNSCVNELCNFNLYDYIKRNIKKIGIIFNIDLHTGDGKHWVAIYIDINKGSIFYFDSIGNEPYMEFVDFMNKVKIQGDELLYNNRLQINNTYNILKNSIKEEDNIIKVDDSNDLKIGNIVYCSNNKIKYNYSDINKIVNIDNNYIVLEKQIKKCKYLVQKTFRIFYNTIQHQKDNNECGMYCIHFLDSMIHNKDFYSYIKKINSDKLMNDLRFNKFFTPTHYLK